MPLYEFECAGCEKFFERILRHGEQTDCTHCGSKDVTKLMSLVHYEWNCSSGGSTQPKHRQTQETGRQEAKRERLTDFCENEGRWGSSQRHD